MKSELMMPTLRLQMPSIFQRCLLVVPVVHQLLEWPNEGHQILSSWLFSWVCLPCLPPMRDRAFVLLGLFPPNPLHFLTHFLQVCIHRYHFLEGLEDHWKERLYSKDYVSTRRKLLR